MGWSGSYNLKEEWVRWKGDLSMSKTLLNGCKLKTNLLQGCLCTSKICINHNLTESLGTPGWQHIESDFIGNLSSCSMDGQGRICQPASQPGDPVLLFYEWDGCRCWDTGINAGSWRSPSGRHPARQLHSLKVCCKANLVWFMKETCGQRGTFVRHTILLQNLDQAQHCSSLLHPVNVCLPLVHF